MLTINLSQAKPVAHADLPDVPGCYALVADPQAMHELSLKPGSSRSVLYVGKAEDSIRKRVSGTHLVESRTGSSTLRRSIGAHLTGKAGSAPTAAFAQALCTRHHELQV